MKKRLFTVILAVIVAITFMPQTIFGVSSVGSYKDDNNKITFVFPDRPGQGVYVRHNTLSSKIKHTDNLLETVKQLLQEEKDMSLSDIESNESNYCQEVLDSVAEISAEFDRKVDAVDSMNDIGDMYMGFIFLNEDISKPLIEIEILGKMTKQYATSSKDLNVLKGQLKNNVTNTFKMYQSEDFTEYYWGIVKTKKSDLLSSINAISSFRDYADVEYEFLDDGYGNINLDDDEDFEMRKLSEIKDSDDEDEESLYYESCWVYNKYEVDEYKENFQKWADVLVNKDMKKIGYTNAAKDFKSDLESTKKQIRSEVDCDVMYLDYLKFEKKVLKAAKTYIDAKEPVSDGDIIRFQKKMTDIYMQYKVADYSAKRWKELKDIYELYMSDAELYEFQDQINDSVLKEMKKKMDKVPNLKTELKNLKNKRIKQIKKYAKNKKFNQKKSIPLANKAVKKIKAAKTKTQVNKIYKTYKKKISKTVKK